jgi:hypothetical protein
MVPEREHVMFDLLWNSDGPARTRQVMQHRRHLLIGGLAAWALPGLLGLCALHEPRGHAGAGLAVHPGCSCPSSRC